MVCFPSDRECARMKGKNSSEGEIMSSVLGEFVVEVELSALDNWICVLISPA